MENLKILVLKLMNLGILVKKFAIFLRIRSSTHRFKRSSAHVWSPSRQEKESTGELLKPLLLPLLFTKDIT